MQLKVKKLRENAILPQYAHPGDAGLDLYASDGDMLDPGEVRLIKTGISIELPAGTEAQIRPRSGLALNHRITVLNAPGTIDEGYRGEIGIILINHGQSAFHITEGMKIAQMVIQPVLRASVIEVDTFSESERGQGGFGSTGV